MPVHHAGLIVFTLLFELFSHFLAWEKGYRGDGWDGLSPTTSFVRHRVRNHAEDRKPYHKEMKREEKNKQNDLGRELVKRESIVDELARIAADLEELRVRRTRLADHMDALLKRLERARTLRVFGEAEAGRRTEPSGCPS